MPNKDHVVRTLRRMLTGIERKKKDRVEISRGGASETDRISLRFLSSGTNCNRTRAVPVGLEP